MNNQFRDFFDNTNQIHILLSITLLCIIITFVAPAGVNYIGKPLVVLLLSYILYKNFMETRIFQKKSSNKNTDDTELLREMKTNILSSYVLCGFMFVLLLYVIYTIVN